MPIPSITARWRWALSVAPLLALQAVQPAHAVPSYSRQTGSECAACHIGAFGPHLTPYGIKFKLGGYTDSDGKGTKIPLAVAAQVSSAQTEGANPTTHGRSDTRLTGADIFIAGKLFDNVGTYTRIAHSEGVAPSGSDFTALDDFDLRFAKEGKLGERDLVWGLTLNNNPGVQDPIDVMPAWGFGAPGPGRDFFQGTRTGTLMNKYQGGVAHRVLGLTGYAFIDSHWYAEVGSYKSMSTSLQNKLGLLDFAPGAEVGDPGKMSNSLYWRGAWLHDMKTQFYSLGVFGFRADLAFNPNLADPRSAASDRYNDTGVDASYMYLGTREHMVQLRASHILERRRYGSQVQNPFFPAFSQSTGSVRETTVSGTYVLKNTWGITAARTWGRNTADIARFVTANGQANSYFTYIGPFWNVWGKEGDPVPIGTNLQIGFQLFRFDRFNGATTNIFGPGTPRAKDLNSALLYARVAL